MNEKRTAFWVVIPCYNEALGVTKTLEALAAQDDRRFSLVVVDNASTDGTSSVVEAFAARHPTFDVHVVHEAQKGTGAAADTGFRYAISHGATHVARTDGDCLPRRDWVRNLKAAFDSGADFVAGHIGHRTDDHDLSLLDLATLTFLTEVMAFVSPFLSHNRGSAFLSRYVMAG